MYSKAFSALFIGKPLISLDAIDSTNTYAQELVSKSNPSEGTAVFTTNQTAGKGQYGRVWVSDEAKNIAVSIILRPKFLAPVDSYHLTVVSALAVAELMENHIDKEVFIKWPNDIYVKNRKIAGILIENTLNISAVETSVIGIGINVNQNKFATDIPNPSSMSNELNQQLDCHHLLQELFCLFEKYYRKLKNQQTADLYHEYEKRLFRKDTQFEYIIKEVRQLATIRGIDKIGRLKVETITENVLLSLNEIKYII